VQARRIRPDTGPTDRRRLAAAGLSAVLPGLGQAFNQRRRLNLVRILLVPENRGLLADIAMNSGWVAAGDQDDIVRERQLPQVANRSPLLSFV